MASSLQEQLQKIAAAAGIATGRQPRGKASLLHTYQEAADIGLQDIYEVAVQGFDKLCRLDPRFHSYRKTLFSQTSQGIDRDQQPEEVNVKLDASIMGFCGLLSNYFLLPAAFKALEYLVRRFNVHERNVAALMHAALPYHATNEFVRIVQILRLDGTPFAFLEPMQKSGAALPRETLVQRCLTDQSLFRFVCEMAKDLGATRVASRAAMPFYAAVLCEYIAAVPTVTEPLVTFLLPYLAHGLTADVTSDYRAATYMALVQLTTRATLTEALIDGIVLELCKSTTPAGLPQALLVLCHLSVTQPHFAAFPEAGFKHLAKLPGLTAELKKLVEKGSRAQALVTMMAAVAAELVPAHGAYAKLMDDIVGTVPLGPGARAAAEQLLSCALSTQHGDAGKARLVAALRGLDQRYPAACEAAVNAALKGLEGGDKGEEAGAAKEKLVSILEEAFAGSLRSPLLEAGATLAVAVDAASAHNRRLALEKLDSMAADAQVAATEGEAGEAEGVLRGALLRRLADDSPTVVQTVLGLQSLLRLPPAALLEGLSTCLSTALAAANKKQTRKSDRAAARGIAKKVIKVLTGPFAAEHPGEVERIADLVLPAALASAHTKKVAQTAVKRGQKLGHPLLQALHNMPSGHSAQKESPQKKGKKAPKKKAAPAEPKGMNEDFHNAAVLLALAERVASDASALEALAKMLSSAEPRAQALALAVANAALHSGAGDDLATIVLARFTASGGSIPARSLFEAPAVAFESDSGTGVASPASLLALARGTLSAASIEPPAVLASISLLSADGLLQLGRQGLERLFVRLAQLPSATWQPHLTALVERLSHVVDASEFLSDIWAAPPETDAPAVQVTALHLWTELSAQPHGTSPTKASKGRKAAPPTPPGAAGPVALLPRLLGLLGHVEPTLRAAAARSAGVLAESIDAWWEEGAAADGLDKATAAAVLGGIGANAGSIEADTEAAEALLRRSLELSGAEVVAPATARKARSAAGRKKQTEGGAGSTAPHLGLSDTQAAAFGAYLLASIPKQSSDAGLASVPFAIGVVHDWAPPQEVLLAAHRLLRAFALEGSPPALRALASQLNRRVASELLTVFNDASLATLLHAGGQDAADVVESLCAMMAVPGPTGSAVVRKKALTCITPTVFTALPDEAQRTIFKLLMAASSQDVDDQCRAAAQASLAAIPLSAELLIPLLELTPQDGQASPGPSKRKRRLSDPKSPKGSQSVSEAAVSGGFSTCLATLEVLQWRDDVAGSLLLVPCLETTAQTLLEKCIAVQTQEEGDDTSPEAIGVQAAQAYGMQLALARLLALAQQHSRAAAPVAPSPAPKSAKKSAAHKKAAHVAHASPFDLAIAVRCTQLAPDASVRSVALQLVSTLAAAQPEAALAHVLDIVAVVGDSSVELIDAHSNAVAAQALVAVASAWTQGGSPLDDLVNAVTSAVAGAPPTRRLPLLSALASALPEAGLCMIVLLLLERRLAAQGDAAEGVAWALDVASSLLQQSDVKVQAETMASLLQTSMDRSGGYNPTAPLVLLTTAFVTTRLEGIPSRKGEADDQLEAAYGMVMERALQQLQRIGELSASRGKKVSHEALAAATSGVYKSIEALQKVMSPVSFISALVTLISVGVDKVRRRALGLLTSSIQDAVANERPGSKEARAVTTAALAAVTPIADTFSGKAVAANGEVPTELTRQVALGALGALAQALGAAHPQSFVPGVSKVLLLTVVTEPQPVRSSALTCVAALVAALGQHMLPVLPATVASVLKAAKLAAAEVKASGAVGGAGAEGDQGGAKDARQEAAILELASALSAVSALVAKLGAFLAPQLPDVLAVVLHPSVLTCSAAHCTELGAGIRKELAEKVPARLLLAPLAAAFDKAAAAGADAVCALLDMLATAIGAMDAAAIASYHETVFAALLRALDSRRRAVLGADNAAEAAISADVQRMESAAVEALVELTLKLSESRFKPLFFRLLEWATAAPAAEESNSIATSTLPRLVSLFAAVNALAERLRSVFTPYFQALLDPALAALDPGGTAGTASTKKKRKKGASAAPGDGLAAELAPLDSLLRLQVIRALHRCFLYDATGFLDEARFDRILGPLVAQLHWEPPAQEVLEELPLSSGLEGSLHPAAAAALDAPARALVACLAQMSLAAGGGDARWRPLNHAVLMATRSTVTRTRLAALEAAAALAAALQEEYLPLLPEALPFLAELLEDDQHAIEARAAETVKALEELSGEDLKEYLRS